MTLQEFEAKYKDVKIIWYSDIEAIFKEWVGPEEYNQKSHVTYNDGQKNRKTTIKEWQDAMEKLGVWGFCDQIENSIHLYYNGKADPSLLADLIGHELGHLMEPIYKYGKKEEHKANSYGYVAMKTFDIIKERTKK